MNASRLYLDEDAAQRDLVSALQARGVDVTCAQDVQLTGASDRVQMEWCRAEGRVLYTFNVRHFYALHCEYLAAGKHHARIVLAPQQRYSIGEQMRRLLRLTATRSSVDMYDRVEFLTAWD